MRFTSLASRFFQSSTLMTMGGFLAKSLSAVVVIPLVLRQFPEAEIQLWLSFSMLIGLQNLADFGFVPTAARVFSYAFGGALKLGDGLKPTSKENLGEPNWPLIGQIFSTLKTVYLRLNLIAFGALLTFGTWALYEPIQQSSSPERNWLAWGVILLVSVFYVRGNIFMAFLEGVDKVALLRRWEMIFHLCSVFSSLFVLLLGGDLLWLIAFQQSWLILNVVRNSWLSHRVHGKVLPKVKRTPFSQPIYRIVFSRSWKSAVGQLSVLGVTQVSGLVYGTIGQVAQVNSYLLSLRIIQMIAEFARAPFYSQLPRYNALVARNELNVLVKLAQRSMAISTWLFTIGVIGAGVAVPILLPLIGSNAEFAPPLLWSLLGIGLFAERYGALHIQLYTTTNHVVWHIVNSISGLLFVTTLIVSLQSLGMYAFALAFIVSNWGFYLWYNFRLTYRMFPISFLQFESRVSLVPLLMLLGFLIASIN